MSRIGQEIQGIPRQLHGSKSVGDPAKPRTLRVVHLICDLMVGGSPKLMVEFAKYADRKRFDLQFVALGGRGSTADEIEAFGWPVTALEKPEGLQPVLLLRLARLFRRWRADVVHTHDIGPLVYAAPAARLARVKGVFHTRHHGSGLDFGHRPTRVIQLLSSFLDRFVCVSRESASLGLHEGLSTKKLMTIWNGIDLARFPCAGPKSDGPVVVVARLSPEKNIEMLLDAVALMSRDQPEVRLEIAGDGPCRADLEAKARVLGIADRVVFHGTVSDIPGLLARSSVMALPSKTEGISLTLLEGMARGLPIVTTRVGGNVEVVVDGVTGLLVPSDDATAMAEAILSVIRDPRRGWALGQAGRSRVEDHFDSRRMVADYEALYLKGRS